MLAYLAWVRQEVGRVGGLWMNARGHKDHRDHPGGEQVTGKIGEYDFRLLNDEYYNRQIALSSIRLNQFLSLRLIWFELGIHKFFFYLFYH